METLNVLSMLSNGLRSISNTFYNAAQENLTVFMQNKQYDTLIVSEENVTLPPDEEMKELNNDVAFNDTECYSSDIKDEFAMDLMAAEQIINENEEGKMNDDIEMGDDHVIDEKIKVSEDGLDEGSEEDEKETGDVLENGDEDEDEDDPHNASSDDEDSDDVPHNGFSTDVLDLGDGAKETGHVDSNIDISHNIDFSNEENADINVNQKIVDDSIIDGYAPIADCHVESLCTPGNEGPDSQFELSDNKNNDAMTNEDISLPDNVDESSSFESHSNKEAEESIIVMEKLHTESVDKITSITENFKKKLQKLQDEAVKKSLSELSTKPLREKNEMLEADVDQSDVVQNDAIEEKSGLSNDGVGDSLAVVQADAIGDHSLVGSVVEGNAEPFNRLELTGLSDMLDPKCIEVNDSFSFDMNKSNIVLDASHCNQENIEEPVEKESEMDDMNPKDLETEVGVIQDIQSDNIENQVDSEKEDESIKELQLDEVGDQPIQEKKEESLDEIPADDLLTEDAQEKEDCINEEPQMDDAVNQGDEKNEELVDKEIEVKDCVDQVEKQNIDVIDSMDIDADEEKESSPEVKTVDLSKGEFDFGKIEACVTVDKLDLLNALYDVNKSSNVISGNNDDDSEFAVGGKKIKKMEVSGSKFTCEECGRHFRRNNHLVTHRKIHAKKIEEENPEQVLEKPYAQSEFVAKSLLCQICGKSFKKKGFLDRHLRIKH